MAVQALCNRCSNVSNLKKLLMLGFTLWIIICLVSDGVNARKQGKKDRPRNKARNRATKNKYPQVFTAGNGVTLPTDTETKELETKAANDTTLILLDPSDTSRSRTRTGIELKPTKSPSSTTPKPKKAPRPHIIFVIADDLGFNDVGYHTSGTGCVAHTPNINNLALTGVRLENYYVQPSCSPTRASILTGRYPVSNERSRFKS